MLSCTIDLRPGGAWRFVQRGPDGNEYAFSGMYRELVRPERIVQTWNFEGIPPGHESVETLTLQDLNGKTKWTTHVLFKSAEKQAKRETRHRAPERLLFTPPWDDGPSSGTLVTVQPQGTFTSVDSTSRRRKDARIAWIASGRP